MYRGDWDCVWESTQGSSRAGAASGGSEGLFAYTLELDNWRVAPAIVGPAYPMSMINEPPSGASANAFLRLWNKLPPLCSERLASGAVHAGPLGIDAGAEVFFAYGTHEPPFDYPKGGSCAAVRRDDVELPATYLHQNGLDLPPDAYMVENE